MTEVANPPAVHVPVPLVGQAIGDALGAPFEFCPATAPELVAWTGGYRPSGVWGLQAGQYTDDTKMARALAESLVACGRFNQRDVADRYVDWYHTGDLRGIGGTCAAGIHNLISGADPTESGARGTYAAGNGTAMRAGPIGLWYRDRIPAVIAYAVHDAEITHANPEAYLGSVAVAVGVARLARGESPAEVYAHVRTIVEQYNREMEGAGQPFVDNFARVAALAMSPAQALDILGTSGYVTHTVPAAFFCLLRATSFEETVVMAVKGGGDADTTGAVAGALAGAHYGLAGIPEALLQGLEHQEDLLALDRALAAGL